eukprot:scaffold116543_cov28-Tisochrysis_lutea.AAC.5
MQCGMDPAAPASRRTPSPWSAGPPWWRSATGVRAQSAPVGPPPPDSPPRWAAAPRPAPLVAPPRLSSFPAA